MATKSTYPSKQKGFVLLTGMIFLAILMLITVNSMTSNQLQVRMAANTQDREMALESAESAIERMITVIDDSPDDFLALFDSSTAFECLDDGIQDQSAIYDNTDLIAGFFINDQGLGCVVPVWAENTVNFPSGQLARWDVTDSRYAYEDSVNPDGTLTTTTGNSANADFPRIKVELYQDADPVIYRITAKGQGNNTNTEVRVQVYYAP